MGLRDLKKIIFNLHMIENKYNSKEIQFVFGKMPEIQFAFGRNLKKSNFFTKEPLLELKTGNILVQKNALVLPSRARKGWC